MGEDQKHDEELDDRTDEQIIEDKLRQAEEDEAEVPAGEEPEKPE